MYRALWIAASAFVLLVGCSSEGEPSEEVPTPGGDEVPTPGGDEVPTPGGDEGACAHLEGRTFASLSELECGLGPDGVVLCNWQLRFEPEGDAEVSFEWTHSDVSESGSCTCEDNTVTCEASSQTYTGTYDASTDHITWDGEEYAPAP